MNDVLHLSIRDIGIFNSLPWILNTITSFGFGFIIDRLIAKGKIQITNARKLAVFLGKSRTQVKLKKIMIFFAKDSICTTSHFYYARIVC